MTEERFNDAITTLTTELRAVRDELGQLRLELVTLRERTNPIVEWFWKAIGAVVLATLGAVLALVLRNGGK